MNLRRLVFEKMNLKRVLEKDENCYSSFAHTELWRLVLLGSETPEIICFLS